MARILSVSLFSVLIRSSISKLLPDKYLKYFVNEKVSLSGVSSTKSPDLFTLTLKDLFKKSSGILSNIRNTRKKLP